MRAIHLETDLFEFWDEEAEEREALQPGEPFAHWLKEQLADLPYELDEPIGEDWGWGFFALREKEKFWIAISFAGITDDQKAGCWVVSVDPQRGLLGFFRKKKPELIESLWSGVVKALESNEGIRITLRE